MVTKSGTNHFHGQAYELNQNNHLQAKNYRQGNAIPFLQHNEWGAQLGGPVWIPKVYNGRNRTFFFVDLEWIKQNANGDRTVHGSDRERTEGEPLGRSRQHHWQRVDAVRPSNYKLRWV